MARQKAKPDTALIRTVNRSIGMVAPLLDRRCGRPPDGWPSWNQSLWNQFRHRIDANADASRFSTTTAPKSCIGDDRAVAHPRSGTGGLRISAVPPARMREFGPVVPGRATLPGASSRRPRPAIVVIIRERMLRRTKLIGREYGSK